MIIIAETHEENEIVAKLAKEHSCRAIAREDGYGFTVWSVNDLKSKYPEISDDDALCFLEKYENRLKEGCISGGWDFLDYADYSECPSLNGEEVKDSKIAQIVEYIVDLACNSTDTGEWSIYAEDVCEDFNISRDEYVELHADVVEELCKRDEIVHLVDVGDLTIDLELDTDYCKRFEGRIYEYNNGELKKKASLSDMIEEAAERVETGARAEQKNNIHIER